MLGLSLAVGGVLVAFGDEPPKKSKKAPRKKKGGDTKKGQKGGL